MLAPVGRDCACRVEMIADGQSRGIEYCSLHGMASELLVVSTQALGLLRLHFPGSDDLTISWMVEDLQNAINKANR